MFIVLIMLAVLVAVVYRGTTEEQRQQFLEQVIQPAAAKMDGILAAAEPFRTAVRARTAWMVLTPVLAGLYVLTFVAILFGQGAFGAPATLIDWGANYAPLTTNGEWWRILTAIFVPGGPFHLLFTLIGLVQVCELLERLVGPALVAAVYLTAGMIANLVSLADHPLVVHAGGSAAVYGLFGLLLAVTVWGRVRRTGLTIPLPVFETLVPASVLFFLYTIFTDGLASWPNLTGLVIGALLGLVFGVRVGERKPPLRPLVLAMAAAAIFAGFLAWPLRGVVDVRPDLVDLIARERRQANVFRVMVSGYLSRNVALDRRAVTVLIERTFLPQLAESRGRVAKLTTTLRDQQALIVSAAEYVRLREQGWRLRAEGLRHGKMAVLREADLVERASLAALEKLRSVDLTIRIQA